MKKMIVKKRISIKGLVTDHFFYIKIPINVEGCTNKVTK
jgi:hypothetical protein